MGADTSRFAVGYDYDYYLRPRSIAIATNTPIVFPERGFGYNVATGTMDTIRVGDRSYVQTFDKEGLRIAVALGQSNHVRSDSFTTRHQPYLMEVKDTSGTLQLWRGHGYDQYDRLMSSRRGSGIASAGDWFAFDSLGRLVEWHTTTAKAALCPVNPDFGLNCEFNSATTTTYTYDAVGNDTLSGNATYGTGNRLTSWSGTTFENDANGARTRRCTGVSCATRDIRYGWSNENLLARVVVGTDTTYYDYNAFGVLVRKRKNGNQIKRHFLWEGGHLLAELDSTARGRVSEYAYYPGTDRPLALITGVDGNVTLRVRSILQDEIGNVTAVLDADSVQAQFAYDPWGVVTSSAGSASSVVRLGWKGLLFEGDSTQLYYVRNRWYDPDAHRFVSEDPIGLSGGLNLYVFGGNDPVNGRDPTGLDVTNVRCTYKNSQGESATVIGTCKETMDDCYEKSLEDCMKNRGGGFLGATYITVGPTGFYHTAVAYVVGGGIRIAELEGAAGIYDLLFPTASSVHAELAEPLYGEQDIERYSWWQVTDESGVDRLRDAVFDVRSNGGYNGTLYSWGDSNAFTYAVLRRAGLSHRAPPSDDFVGPIYFFGPSPR